MRRGEPERASQTLRLRVRRNYCWDEKSETGEKNPASAVFAGMPGYDRTGQDRTERDTTDKTHGLLWARVAL